MQKSLAQDTFNLGPAAPSNYAVLALTSGVSITGSSGVIGSAGNVGVAGGGFSMSDGIISGVLSINTHGATNISGGTHIQGGIVQNTANDAVLANAVNAAQNQSAYYAGLASTGTYPKSINISNPSNNVTLTGHSGLNVVNLASINLTNGVLTLSAPSDGQFVVNVTGGFTINSACYIALAGGIGPFNVLINVVGAGSVVTINGSTKVTENGIILAPYRSISYHDQTIDGALIGAQVTITSGGHVVDTATPPSTGCASAAFAQGSIQMFNYYTDEIDLGAPASTDTVITLTNSNPGLLTTPATVTIPAGQTSVTFQIQAGNITGQYDSETITAYCANGTPLATQSVLIVGS